MNAPNRFQLNDRVVLITGAAGHLGRAISLGVAEAGGIPILCGRTPEKLHNLQTEIQAAGGRASVLPLDIGDPSSMAHALTWVTQHFDSLHGLVNCAHMGRPGTISSATEDDFNIAQQAHVNGPFFLVKQFLPLLKQGAGEVVGGASIVNVSSMYGIVSPDPTIYGNSGSNNPPYYGAAKAALLQLTRYLACHLGDKQVRANSITPGPFPPADIAQTTPDFYQSLCKKNPLGRIGVPEEVAGPTVFLLSAASSYITGANIPVDGGWTSW